MVSRPQVEEERMATQAPSATGQQNPVQPLAERPAASVSGVGVLVGSIVALVAGIVLVLVGIFQSDVRGLIVLGIVLFPVADIGFHGLTAVDGGGGRVGAVFGDVQGDGREP